MNFFTIEETPKTPAVTLDPEKGLLEIVGRSVPSEAEEFWDPILEQFDTYCLHPAAETSVKINLEYFNISSSKRLLFLLYKMNDLIDRGFNVEIEWMYKENDEDMYEVGRDYAFMVKVPFHFVSYVEEVALAI
ncbi:MAG: DUF1987 domain-containing protein [Crocinitomicaceae bacterium]